MSIIPFDDRDGYIWLDNELVEWRKAKIHILCHGLHYASSVFEGERLYDGHIFRSREHSDRLIKSANLIGMDVPWSAEELDALKEDVIKANALQNAYIRPVLWRGAEEMGISAQATQTHLAIAAWEWGKYFDEEKHKKGISLKTSTWRKPDPQTAPTESKTACLYSIGTMSKHFVENQGFDDALMLDYRGFVAESTGANFFAVQDGIIKTPIADCFLNGLTRQSVIALAKSLNIEVQECRIKPEDLKSFDEIFLTGTAAEVTAVGVIDDISYEVGPVTCKLRDAYTELVHSLDLQKNTL